MYDLEKLLASCELEINNCVSIKKLNEIKNLVLGKNGRLTEIMKSLKTLSDHEKKMFGTKVNFVKTNITEKINAKSEELELIELEKKIESEFIDVTLPCKKQSDGKLHPLTQVFDEISDIFSSYGFLFQDGPEIESEYFNFSALNMPEHHPARTMHDTFYINSLANEHGRKLLRTHTSPVQIHSMLSIKAPLKVFTIGRTYRSDFDATHTPMFNQIEGLIIDKNIGFSHLKWLLIDFLKKFFQVNDIKIRFRPSFFPFTEPSAEVDINYSIENGKMIFGKGDNWLEVCGCGMVHPNVLKSGNINSEIYQGMAFGFGLERLTSLKYGITDLREYFESNYRWREYFGFTF